jgi:hypothetical protein
MIVLQSSRLCGYTRIHSDAEPSEEGASGLLMNVNDAECAQLLRFSGRTIKGVFELARQLSPTVIFFDEIDAVGSRRSGSDDPASRRVLTEMLVSALAVLMPGPNNFVTTMREQRDINT